MARPRRHVRRRPHRLLGCGPARRSRLSSSSIPSPPLESCGRGRCRASSTSFRVISYDARGHGFSQPPPATTPSSSSGRDALAILDDAGAESAHVCGISLGGITAHVDGRARAAPGREPRARQHRGAHRQRGDVDRAHRLRAPAGHGHARRDDDAALVHRGVPRAGAADRGGFRVDGREVFRRTGISGAARLCGTRICARLSPASAARCCASPARPTSATPPEALQFIHERIAGSQMLRSTPLT